MKINYTVRAQSFFIAYLVVCLITIGTEILTVGLRIMAFITNSNTILLPMLIQLK